MTDARHGAIWILGAALALGLVGLAPAPARALSLTLAGPTSGPLTGGIGLEPVAPATSQLQVAVGLDAVVSLNGFDVTLAWDPAELALAGASGVPGLALDTAPTAGGSAGSRVAAIELVPVSTDLLFTATFDLLGGGADGLADVRVFVDPVTNGAGLSPGSLALANPAGAGLDVAVPEPGVGLLVLAGAAALARRRLRRPPPLPTEIAS